MRRPSKVSYMSPKARGKAPKKRSSKKSSGGKPSSSGKNSARPEKEYPRAPADADLSYITEDLRPLARPLDIARPDPNNTKKHGSRDVGVVQGLYEKYTIRGAIVVQERPDGLMIRAGHGRWLAAKQAGHEYIPMVIIRGSSDELETQYGIEDNVSATLVSVDREMVAKLMAQGDMELEFVEGLYDEADMQELVASSMKYAEELPESGLDVSYPVEKDHEPLGTNRDKSRPGKTSPVLRWGTHQIQLTEHELLLLEAALEQHYEAKGTTYGFVSTLLGGAEDSKLEIVG
jgi:hypothetical protein